VCDGRTGVVFIGKYAAGFARFGNSHSLVCIGLSLLLAAELGADFGHRRAVVPCVRPPFDVAHGRTFEPPEFMGGRMRSEVADEADLAPHDIAAAAADMERILEQEPKLSNFGFGLSDF
jgi:hypothetical protein